MRAEGKIFIWQLVSAWLVCYGFRVLSMLSNVRLLDDQGLLNATHVTAADLTSFILWLRISELLGLLLITFFSFWFSRRYKYHWVVPLLLFGIIFTLNRLDLHGPEFLRHVFALPGRLFEDTTMSLMANGLVLVALGTSALLFSLPDRRKDHAAPIQPSHS